MSRAQLLHNPALVQKMSAAELMHHTEQMTLWVRMNQGGGLPSWLSDTSIVESRYYAAEYQKFIRKSGFTECAHSLASADLMWHIAKTHPFGKIASVFIQNNHDRVENNRLYITNYDIVETCWHGPEWIKPYILHYQNEMTDSDGLSKEDRMGEQIERANRDELLFLPPLRITEKTAAFNEDIYNTYFGLIPHNGDVCKALSYTRTRVDTVDQIHVSERDILVKQMFMSQAACLTRRILTLLYIDKKQSFNDRTPAEQEAFKKNLVHIKPAKELIKHIESKGGKEIKRRLCILKPPHERVQRFQRIALAARSEAKAA